MRVGAGGRGGQERVRRPWPCHSSDNTPPLPDRSLFLRLEKGCVNSQAIVYMSYWARRSTPCSWRSCGALIAFSSSSLFPPPPCPRPRPEGTTRLSEYCLSTAATSSPRAVYSTLFSRPHARLRDGCRKGRKDTEEREPWRSHVERKRSRM